MVNHYKITHEQMKKIGIDILTGEACALSMRLLCELTPECMQLYINYTGIRGVKLENLENSSWNDRNKYSVFLTWEVMEDLLIFWLLKQLGIEKVVEIIPNPSQVKELGISGDKHLLAGDIESVNNYIEEGQKCHRYNTYTWNEEEGKYKETPGFFDIGRIYAFCNTQPRREFSNVHGWTGRSQ
jgi:hypothetical protein